MPPPLKPSVWYIAAGYKLPAGIEAYLLHYATELRNYGFDTRVIVFEPLPKVPHRFLVALRERGIPIESLYERVGWQARIATVATYLPWRIRKTGKGTLTLALSPQGRGNSSSPSPLRGEGGGEGGPVAQYGSLLHHWTKRLAVLELKRMIAREEPDIIHVKGRIITEAWAVLPRERTLFHVATSGQRDASWSDAEVEVFRRSIQGCARVLAPGTLVAETFKKEFGITRPVDMIFTMAPDERAPEAQETTDHRLQTADFNVGAALRGRSDVSSPPKSDVCSLKSAVSSLRFGILCRFSLEKGIPVILEALKILDARGVPLRFTFVGQGELERVIREWSKREEWTHVTVIPVTSAARDLREMDVFVHPSSSEAMPVSIVEALMQGLPCIATPVGGIPDLIRDGTEGALVPVGDAVALADAMARFTTLSSGEFTSFQQRARARYEEVCRPEIVRAEVEGIYRAMMGGVERPKRTPE